MTASARLVVLLDTALPRPVPPAYCGRNATTRPNLQAGVSIRMGYARRVGETWDFGI